MRSAGAPRMRGKHDTDALLASSADLIIRRLAWR
jgi:hypothetical protein